MNLKKKMRRGSLAALIALALTHSALAMPMGGEVVRGVGDITVDGGTNFSVINNNATITATNDGQINWATFDIANGETLNFDIANDKTLVNQVTGAQVSDILGTMNQTGGGNIVLVNPNGIHVGQNAVLNVSDLTLSALAIDKASETERVLKKTGEGFINVDTGAHFTANELSLIGTKVTVADGVTFDIGATAGTEKGLLQVYATDSASWTFDDDRVLTKNLTHNAGNDVVFNGTVNMLGGANSLVEIGGATTAATNARFIDNRAGNDHVETTLYAASKFDLDERGTDRNNHRYSAETTAANTVTVDGLTANGESLSLGGGAITVKNSTVGVDDLKIMGISSYTGSGDGKRTEYTSASDRTVNIESSTLRAYQGEIFGGKVTVADNVTLKLAAPAGREAETMIIAGNRFLRKRGEDHRDVLIEYRAAAGNDVAFHGTTAHEGAGTSSLGLVGFTTNADHAKLHGDRTEFSLDAFTRIDYNQEAADWRDYRASMERSAANRMQADGLEVRTKRTFYADGGSVDLKNSDIETGEFTLVADTRIRGDGDTEVGNLAHEYRTARPENVVRLTNVHVRRSVDAIYNNARIFGGMVTMERSSIASIALVDIFAGASYNRTYTGSSDQEIALNVTKDNALDLRRTTITAPRVRLGAGTIGVWDGSRIESPYANSLEVNPTDVVTRRDGSAASVLRDATSHVVVAGVASPAFTESSEPIPPVPQPPVIPETPALSADDAENIAEGARQAGAALTEATQEARAAALTETVAKLNENATTSRRQTAGIVVGMVREIAEDTMLTGAEKTALQIAVLDAYAPVQDAKAEQDNLATNAVDEAVSATTTVTNAPVYPDASEVEEVVSFA